MMTIPAQQPANIQADSLLTHQFINSSEEQLFPLSSCRQWKGACNDTAAFCRDIAMIIYDGMLRIQFYCGIMLFG